jgi:hypothetical protein
MLKAVRQLPSGKLNGPGAIGNLPLAKLFTLGFATRLLPNELAPQQRGISFKPK